MSRGLVHLITTDDIVKRSYEYSVENINNIRTTLLRNADTISPDYILIDLTNQTQTVNDIINNYTIKFFALEDSFIKIPLKFLSYITTFTTTSQKKLKIPINFNYFFRYTGDLSEHNGMPMIALQSSEIKYLIENNNNNEHNIISQIFFKYTYLDSNERRILAQYPIDINSRHIQTCKIKSDVAEIKYQINGTTKLQGFVLQMDSPGSNIENIKNIKFLVGDTDLTRHDLNSDFIDIACQKLSSNAIYLSLNFDGTLETQPFTNNLSLRIAGTTKIIITTNLDDGFEATIFFLESKKITVESGFILLDQAQSIFFTEMLKTLSDWKVKKINFDVPNDYLCPITFDNINLSSGGIYKCSCCNNMISILEFYKWINGESKTCPMCRTDAISSVYYTLSGEHIIF